MANGWWSVEMTDIISSQKIIDKQARQLIAQAAEIERLRDELAEYSEEFPLLQNDLGKALLDNDRLRAALSADAQTLRLHLGEMTSQEMRTLKAGLKWVLSCAALEGK